MSTRAKALPSNIIRAMDPKDRRDLGIRTPEEAAQKIEAKNEAEIQRMVEQYCVHLGFEKRTPENIARGKPLAGWQIHLHKTRANPILLDLLLLHNEGEFLELELKVAGGRLSPEQHALVEQGAPVAYSAETAVEIINQWVLDKGLRTLTTR